MAGKRHYNQRCRVREVIALPFPPKKAILESFRSQNSRKADEFNSTVQAGQQIAFKGTDLLTIDLGSKKVMNATTSSDLLNYYRELGYPLGVWSANTSDESVSA